MIVEAAGRYTASNFIDFSAIFEGLDRQVKSHSNMLQHRASLMNPTPTPSLFISPQSVKGAIDMHQSGMMLNVQA
jgi:hypothetical protein